MPNLILTIKLDQLYDTNNIPLEEKDLRVEN